MKKRYVVLIVAALLVLLLGPLFEPHKSPSSFSAEPGGTKAFFLFLSQLQTPVEQWLYPFKDLNRNPRGSVLIVAAPSQPLVGAEALLEWVKRGNTLVLLDNKSNSIFRELGLSWEAASGGTLLMQVAGTPDAGAAVSCSRNLAELCLEVRSISTLAGHFTDLPSGAQLLAGSSTKALAVLIELDRGRVLAFAGAEPLLNSNLDKFDNLRLLYQIVSDGKRVLIDEFHHGMTAPVAAENAARWNSILMFAGYLTLVLILAALSRAVRFGPAAPEAPAPCSSSLQFAQALGLLYAENGAQDVLRHYRSAWRSRLQRVFGIASSGTQSFAVEELLRRRLVDAASAAAIIRAGKAIDEGATLQTSQLQALEQVFLRPGEPHGRSGNSQ